ncbi:hypothetical protein PCC9214_02435 [Planktothrix tepida]|uniref:Uncharacterized protein n=2 Tax=Planktothrix TaxID=54304 RepID=A0A1J1LJV3_9CYAN|nr:MULTISPECIES: hypothetical protein [Planktothrix]CAD5949094.1 hypothetical protein PCC9214_02435 [Planktothrix tepida]CAD5961674.1 hypothetical protein NO713_03241 [Planktothrix pseudagardhii]CUR32478.1 conserved hypothetical protein [Planktothrix tepida PCC 9214]
MEFESLKEILMKDPRVQRLIAQQSSDKNKNSLILQPGNLPLKQLKIAQVMPHSIRLIIPSKDCNSQPIPNTEKYQEMVKHRFSQWSGGYTDKSGEGGYCSQSGGLMRENITEVETWMTEMQLLQHLDELEGLMAFLLTEMNQETLMLIVDHCAVLLAL